MDQFVPELNERHGIGIDDKPLVDGASAALETDGKASTRHANEIPNQGAGAEAGAGAGRRTGTGRGSGAGLRLDTDARRGDGASEVRITPTPNATTRSSTAGTD